MAAEFSVRNAYVASIPMQGTRMSKLNRLKEQRAVLDARIRQEENKQRAGERKSDTRRKILAGAAVLEWAKRDKEFSSRLTAELRRFLVRDAERELFDLPPLPKQEKSDAA